MAIYLITHHQFNHETPRNGQLHPIDPRFLSSDKRYIYYLIDQKVPPILQQKETVLEYDLDPELHRAGGRYFGEWSFLLAEEKHSFCQYPFFMISSRFYEKNRWLLSDLDREWDQLFTFLNHYGWGYLPSYNRPLRWIDLSWKKKVEGEAWNSRFFPFTPKTYELTEEIFGINIPNDYRFTADLFCNYIGFKSRKELLAYVEFYRPLIDFCFDKAYSPKRDLSPYIKSTGMFRNEKPFTFFLELLCHLFFFKEKIPYFALHYDGYYQVDESQKTLNRLKSTPIPPSLRIKRFFEWEWERLTTEGALCKLKGELKKYQPLYQALKTVKKALQ